MLDLFCFTILICYSDYHKFHFLKMQSQFWLSINSNYSLILFEFELFGKPSLHVQLLFEFKCLLYPRHIRKLFLVSKDFFNGPVHPYDIYQLLVPTWDPTNHVKRGSKDSSWTVPNIKFGINPMY